MTDGFDISSEIALRWTSLDLSDDKATLVQVMAWCRQATSHYLNQCWPRSLPPYGVTRPEWVKSLWLSGNFRPLSEYQTTALWDLCNMSNGCLIDVNRWFDHNPAKIYRPPKKVWQKKKKKNTIGIWSLYVFDSLVLCAESNHHDMGTLKHFLFISCHHWFR